MGIPKIFTSLSTNETIKTKTGFILGFKKLMKCDYLYIDFNSIVYTIANQFDRDLNYLLYMIILNVPMKKTNIVDTPTNISIQSDNILFTNEKILEIVNHWGYTEKFMKNPSIETFKEHFNNNKINEMMIIEIHSYIFFVLDKLIDNSNIKRIFISIDGVPEMGKIIEQRKRRYMGYISSGLKSKIAEKYMDKFPEKRKIFETSRKSFDRGKIVPESEFMKDVNNMLTSGKFIEEIKTKYPSVIEYIVSSQNVPGEGEKKIIEHIVSKRSIGTYVLFSPDADIIILELIVQNLLNNGSDFHMLRYNAQLDQYDSLDISSMGDSIYEYVMEKISGIVGQYDQYHQYSKISILNDVAFMFTLFGNDFVPSIESIDVRNDVETILNSYCEVMKNSKKPYLIFNNKEGIFRISYQNFLSLIDILAQNEESLLHDVYMSTNYKNYKYLKKVFGGGNMYVNLTQYISDANKIFDFVRSRPDQQTITNFINRIIKMPEGIRFIKIFLILETKKPRQDIDDMSESFRDITDSDTEKIGSLTDIFRSYINKNMHSRNVTGNLRLYQFDQNVDTEYHKKKIAQILPVEGMEITDYDIEVYQMDNMMGKYQDKLNTTFGNIRLGGVTLRTDNIGNYYLQTYSVRKRALKYYSEFFNIRDIYDNEGKEKIQHLVNEYVTGLFWVFEFYFNRNNSKMNLSMVSTWFYEHHKAPLIFQIRQVLENYGENLQNEMNDLFWNISDSSTNYIEREFYMDKIEHYLYVTPKNNAMKIIQNLPNYIKLLEENSEVFPDLDDIVDAIWKSDSDSRSRLIIDCRGAPYFNKCHLVGVKYVHFDKFMSIMNPMKISKERSRFNVRNFVAVLKQNMVGGRSKNIDKFMYYKHRFKKLYLNTGDMQYKICYKSLKKIIQN